MTGQYDVVIVGSGHAGAQTAIALRQNGFAGSIAMIGKETVLPYDRPALSKEYLSGKVTLDAMLLRPKEFWSEQTIALHLGCTVTHVDPTSKKIVCDDASTFSYRTLVWAAGGVARRLPCASTTTGNIHTIRELRDVDAIKRDLTASRKIIVIGGGYLGLEAAAAMREMRKSVVVIESSDRLLARVAGETISRFYEAEHKARGVDIRLNAFVGQIVERETRAVGAALSTGETIDGDMIIAAIGLEPAVEPLRAAGASGDSSGIVVDASCLTTLPDVYAVGDCTLQSLKASDGSQMVRLESIPNANEQANAAARSIVGAPRPSEAVPWFWSNQYDLRLQSVGLSAGHDQAVVRGNPASRSFSVAYLRDGSLIAFDCVNASKDFLQGKALVQRRTAPDLHRLADPGVPLKDLAARDRETPIRKQARPVAAQTE